MLFISIICYLLNAQVIESDVVVIIRLGFRISECILLQKEVDASILALNHG